MRPTRPIASCTVAEPNWASRSTAPRSARLIFRLTTPRSVMLFSSCLQCRIEMWIDAPCIAFIYLRAVLATEVMGRLAIALCIVVVDAGLRIDPAHGADHLAGEQDVVDRNHLCQQIDTGLMINTGIEEHVLEQVLA